MALVVTSTGGDNFLLIQPNFMVGRHVCSDKAEFERPLFDALSYVYLADVWSVRYTRDQLASILPTLL